MLNDCRGMLEDEIIETILEERGIDNPEEFFNPSEDSLLPLESLKNIHEAFLLTKNAIENKNSIGIHFDVDVDGITSGTIMTRYLRNFVENDLLSTCINNGKKHGLIDAELYKDVELLIIVDSLDNNIFAYKELAENGISVIVLDHHAIGDLDYDKYVTLVSSQREYKNPQLSGAGVVWKFCKYLDTQFNTNYADELVDLAACGLVADMMDMTNMENRYIVSKGLEKIYNPALKKIIGGFGFNSTSIAFSVAPLINAANRLYKNYIAMNLFLEDDNKTILRYLKELKACKELQKEYVDEILQDVIQQCDKQTDQKMAVAIINTPYGISGLLGNKLLDIYQKPILVLKDTGSSYSGSMRAVGVEDFRSICNESGLAKADGHELAAGIEIKKENLQKFIDYIDNVLPDLQMPIEDIDVQIDLDCISRSFIDEIKKIDRISGTNFKPVKVLIDDISEYEIGQMSDYKHLVLKPLDYLQLIKWNFDGSFDEMEEHSMMNDSLRVIGTLDSGWIGRTFSLKVICDEIQEVA